MKPNADIKTGSNNSSFVKRLPLLLSIVLVLLAASLIYSSVHGTSSVHAGSSDSVKAIRVAFYRDVPQGEAYKKLLSARWKAAGHTEELEFETWDCYSTLPPEGSDLLFYDAVVYNALKDKGFLAPISDPPKGTSFPWINAYFDLGAATDAVPVLLCTNYLIYRRSSTELASVSALTDICGGIDLPLKDMCFYYYVEMALSDGEDGSALSIDADCLNDRYMKSILHMADIIGKERYDRSLFVDYKGKDEYLSGDVEGLFGFSETLSGIEKLKADTEMCKISLLSGCSTGIYPADLVSVSSGCDSEERKLVSELISIMADGDFQYEYITSCGSYTYGLPSDTGAFLKLAGEEPVYRLLYEDASKTDNIINLYGNTFYEDIDVVSSAMRKQIEEHFTRP